MDVDLQGRCWIRGHNVRRGGAVFYAEVPDEKFQAAADALEAAGALDYEEREVAWRREGWSGTAAPTSSSTTTGAARSPGTTGDESIPIVEERLKVGENGALIERSG